MATASCERTQEGLAGQASDHRANLASGVIARLERVRTTGETMPASG